MTHRSFAALLLLPLGLAAPALTSPGTAATTPGTNVEPVAAPQGDLEELVSEELARAADRELEELWRRVHELRQAEALGADGELDRLLDGHVARHADLSPQAVLLLVACRLQGEEPDPSPLAEALRPLFEHPDEGLARGAASLLGDSKFRRLNRSRRKELGGELMAVAQDTDHAPEHRLEFALAAYRVGLGSDRQRSYGVMESFLNSKDPELAAQGALAIAATLEADISGRLRDVLEDLERTPSARGRLAAAYLQVEEEREFAERNLREARKRANPSGELPKAYRELAEVRRLILSEHLEGDRIKSEELMQAAVSGMLHWMDAHSAYFPPTEYAKFMTDLEAEYGGIGAYVNSDPDNGLFTIVRPIYSGPAYRAGLQTDDKIVRIGDWPTLGKSEADIIKRLKGPPGTDVELYVWRRGMDTELIDRPTEDMRVTVRREQIEIPAGSHQLLPGGIGLVELTTFSRHSQDQLEQWIPQMVANGMQALILDMRRNSGGLLTEARDVADVFLPPDKVVVKTEARTQMGNEEHRTRFGSIVPPDMPVVILTSRMTASAAEIVSGALQDHGRATLVGKRTYGKGSVQQLRPILTDTQDLWSDTNGNGRYDEGEPIVRDHDEDGEFDYCPRVKLTIAHYLLPSGRSIHRTLDREGQLVSMGGVEPDHTIDMPLIERWRFDAIQKIQRGDELRDYVEEHYEKNRDLFHRLAVNDLKDPSLYPGFDQLMTSLDTALDRDDVRTALRGMIRRRVQDDLGQEFPFGDYVEDVQVQKGIEVALEELGVSVDSVTEYALVFDREAATDEPGQTLLASTNADIDRMRTLLEGARRSSSTLTEADLDELLRLVGQLEEGQEN